MDIWIVVELVCIACVWLVIGHGTMLLVTAFAQNRGTLGSRVGITVFWFLVLFVVGVGSIFFRRRGVRKLSNGGG